MPHPNPADAIGYAIRSDSPLPADITEIELRQHALERELRRTRATVKHLEGALRCIASVVKPYAGNGR
jgi:hypothetical protein